MHNPKLQAIKKELGSLNSDERLELALLLIHGAQGSAYQAKVVDLNKHAGTVRLPVDGLQFQESLRAESGQR